MSKYKKWVKSEIVSVGFIENIDEGVTETLVEFRFEKPQPLQLGWSIMDFRKPEAVRCIGTELSFPMEHVDKWIEAKDNDKTVFLRPIGDGDVEFMIADTAVVNERLN